MKLIPIEEKLISVRFFNLFFLVSPIFDCVVVVSCPTELSNFRKCTNAKMYV